jgi:hypothetical protein
VGGVDVFDGDVGGDAAEVDQVDGVGCVPGFVQDAVGPDLPGHEADLVEGGTSPE